MERVTSSGAQISIDHGWFWKFRKFPPSFTKSLYGPLLWIVAERVLLRKLSETKSLLLPETRLAYCTTFTDCTHIFLVERSFVAADHQKPRNSERKTVLVWRNFFRDIHWIAAGHRFDFCGRTRFCARRLLKTTWWRKACILLDSVEIVHKISSVARSYTITVL